MRRLFSTLWRDQRGLGLPELFVGLLLSVAALAAVTVWMTTTARTELFQQTDFDALNDLRFARSTMVRDLRFATEEIPTTETDTVSVWVDHDGSGGGAPDNPDEWITWQISGTSLLRYEDNDPDNGRVFVADLLPTLSELSIAGGVVTVVLTADTDQPNGPQARTIRTQVSLRNS